MALTERQKERKKWLEIIILAIESTQLKGIESGAMKYGIHDRSLERYNPEELERLRRRYECELQALEKKEMGIFKKTISVYG